MDNIKENLDRILENFSVATLSVIKDNNPYSFTVFYAYSKSSASLLFASSSKTSHIKASFLNSNLSAGISSHSKKIDDIKGVQILGILRKASKYEEKLYFKEYLYAKLMLPEIWALDINWAKITNNSVHFGYKEIWQRDLKD